MGNLTLLTIGSFLTICLGIGLYTGQNVKTLKDYALRDYTLGAGALAMMATILQQSSYSGKIVHINPDPSHDKTILADSLLFTRSCQNGSYSIGNQLGTNLAGSLS